MWLASVPQKSYVEALTHSTSDWLYLEMGIFKGMSQVK